MLYVINLAVLLLCGFCMLGAKWYFFVRHKNLTFHFTSYVFKNKENVFLSRNLENALTDMLQNKLQNTCIDVHKLQDIVGADFVSKVAPSAKIKNLKKYISQNEKAYNDYLIDLNEKYERIFEYNILKINIEKININLLLKSIINLTKNNTKIAVLLKNNDKNVIKTLFSVSNGNIEKKIIYDRLNILSLIKNNYKSNKIIKNKSFSPKILGINLHYNFVSKQLICMCKNNIVTYSNIFGLKLAEVKFDNVRFFCKKFLVNNADISKVFVDKEILLSPSMAGCMKITFASNLMQDMYDKVCQSECKRVINNILSLRYDYNVDTSYDFFVQKMLGIKILNGNITITPNRHYVNCDFRVKDFGVKVKVGSGKNEYVIDGKVFSNNIPISLEDIEKVDCILY